jgi:hypothetical protein
MAIKFKGDASVAIINSIKKAEVDTVYRCFDSGVLLSNEVINHGDFVSWDGTKWIKRPDLSYLISNTAVPLDSSIAPEYTKKPYPANSFVMHNGVLYTNENAIGTAEDWNPAHWTRTTVAEMMTKIGAPDDAFYVNRGSAWVKAYELQQIVIEGFPVDDTEEYQKIGEFNGYLYPYVAIGVEGTATVGLFNYDTKEYDDEITLTDGAQTTEISTRGKYEIHAKGTGIVTVVVQADEFEEGGSGNE